MLELWRHIRRNPWSALGATVGALWFVFWAGQTLLSATTNKLEGWGAVAVLLVPTVLLLISVVNHAAGRPDIEIADPELLEPYKIIPVHSPGPVDIKKGYRIKVSNFGAPVETTVTLSVEGAIRERVRVLHREGDWPYTAGRMFNERVELATGQIEWFEVVSLGDSKAHGKHAFFHNSREYDGIELVPNPGTYDLVVSATSGREAVKTKRMRLRVDPAADVLELAVIRA